MSERAVKSSRRRKTIIGVSACAAVLLVVALGLRMASTDAEGLEVAHGYADTLSAGLDFADLETEWAGEYVPVAGATVGAPVLTVGGKIEPDVYLQSLNISVEVTGNIASTRYTMVFRNKTGRTLEGMLTFPLPDGRAVTHYALDVGGKMREAVPVEKTQAAQVFEEIQRRRQVIDPGLMERVEGNSFRTRVYPFLPKESRTITVGYEEELTLENGSLRYRLPMAYVDPIETFSVKATVWKSASEPTVSGAADGIRFGKNGDRHEAALTRRNYRPDGTLEFALPVPAGLPRVMTGAASGTDYFVAAVAPDMEPREKRWAGELAVIWDVSLSGRRRNLRREAAALDIIFAEKKNVDINLYFLNNALTGMGKYRVVNGNWDGLKNVLEAAVFDGGTDFSQINLSDIAGGEILLFSDGLSTLGDARFVGNVNNVNNRPIHCFISSANADYNAMRLISGRTKGKFVNINALSFDGLRNELLNETPQFLGAERGASVREVYPSLATPVTGDFSVAGIFDGGDAEIVLLFGFGAKVEKRVRVKLRNAECGMRNAERKSKSKPRPSANNDVDVDVDVHSAFRIPHSALNISRIWAQKKIAELDLDHRKNGAELAELGRRFGLVTRNSSLIVLEAIDDYVLYRVEPPASEPELLMEYRRIISDDKGSLNDWKAHFQPFGAHGPADYMDKWWNSAGLSAPFGYRTWHAARRILNTALSMSKDISELLWPRIYVAADFFEKLPDERAAIIQRDGRTAALGVAGNPAWREGASASGILDSLVRVRDSIAAVRDSVVAVHDSIAAFHDTRTGYANAKLRAIGALTYADNSVERARQSIERARDSLYGIWNPLNLRNPVDARRPDDPAARARDSARVSRALDSLGRVLDSVDRFETSINAVRDSIFNYLDSVAAAVVFYALEPIKPVLNSVNRALDSANRAVKARRDSTDRAALAARDSSRRVMIEKAYMGELTGNLAADYRTYLRLRERFFGQPIFYFDMADWFYRRGDRATALRVLTSIAELELENAAHYRMLGYRLKEYGEYAPLKFVCRKVMEWRPMDPQSYRDYALALADNGEEQAALDMFNTLFTKEFSANVRARNGYIANVALAEMNRLMAKNPNLNTSKTPESVANYLAKARPTDIRVVLNWNTDDVDVDLQVLNPLSYPLGTHDMYGQWNTYNAKALKLTNNSGLGPEEIVARKGLRGSYQVYAGIDDRRAFAEPGPITVMAEIYTDYAGQNERRRIVCLQLPHPQESYYYNVGRRNKMARAARFRF